MNEGWVKIHRIIEENKLWLNEPFTKAQAWLDLIIFANHKDGGFFVRGNWVEVKRGQIGWSQLTMARRWKWSRGKVKRFLKWLKTEQQIVQQTGQPPNRTTTVLTIKNYNRYQSENKKNNTTDGQQTDNRRDINKNEKNEKKEKNIERSLQFLKKIPKKDKQELMEKFHVPESVILEEAEFCIDWIKANGKRPKNYKAQFRNWLRKRNEYSSKYEHGGRIVIRE